MLVPLVGKRQASIIAILVSLFLFGSMSDAAFASSGNWVEVSRFNGTIWGGSTEPFTCDHVDWRIKWSYEPTPGDTSVFPLRFRFNVVEVGGKLVEFFIPPSNQIGGTLNINQTGEFYIAIDTMYVENYTVIVEQNLESIPEFPSWIILPLFLIATVFALVIKKKISSIQLPQ